MKAEGPHIFFDADGNCCGERQDAEHRRRETIVLYVNGSAYHGEISQGTRHGYGRYLTPQGDMYEGQFRYGRAHGKGELCYQGGRIERGDFTFGMPPSCVGRPPSNMGALYIPRRKQGIFACLRRARPSATHDWYALRTLQRLKFATRSVTEALAYGHAYYEQCQYPKQPHQRACDNAELCRRRHLIARLDKFPAGDEPGRAAVGLPVCGQLVAGSKHQAILDAEYWQVRRLAQARAAAAAACPQMAQWARSELWDRTVHYYGALFGYLADSDS